MQAVLVFPAHVTAADNAFSTFVFVFLSFNLLYTDIVLLLPDLSGFKNSLGAVHQVEEKSTYRLMEHAVTSRWDTSLIATLPYSSSSVTLS